MSTEHYLHIEEEETFLDEPMVGEAYKSRDHKVKGTETAPLDAPWRSNIELIEYLES